MYGDHRDPDWTALLLGLVGAAIALAAAGYACRSLKRMLGW